MVLKTGLRFDPEALLTAPRRSVGVPSPDGSQVLYTTSTYSFNKHKKEDELRVLEVATGESKQLAHHAVSDPNWLDDHHFVCLKSGERGKTELCVAKVKSAAKDGFVSAAKIDAPAGNLRLVKLCDNEYAVVVSAPAGPDDKLFNPETAKKTHSTGKFYTKLFVRHWDYYVGRERNSLWYGKLSKGVGGRWSLSPLHNALKGLRLESPIAPFGGTDNFDVSKHGIILAAKDPDLDPSQHTKCNVYYVGIESWTGERPLLAQQVVVPGFNGACTSPVFDPEGTRAAFLCMREDRYESDKNEICMLNFAPGKDIASMELRRAFTINGSEEGNWDRSPSDICFTANGKYLLVIAPEYGRSKLFMMKADLTQHVPYTLTSNGSVSSCTPMENGNIFISGSSCVDSSFYAIVVPVLSETSTLAEDEIAKMTTWAHSLSSDGNHFGLSPGQVSWIRSPASNPSINKEIYSMVLKPSYFDAAEKRKYPVAYLIHGGPQAAWMESWSTRWNPAVFAEQGYIVVCPNPTGSTSYGQALTDAIQANWGGDPYQDIVNVFEWVGSNMPEADNSRAVGLGGSYGGYMMSWIQGNDLGRRLKCIVWHDGITSFESGLLPTDELFFMSRDLGNVPWYNGKGADPKRTGVATSKLPNWKKWDPSQYLHNWNTPMLVIHSAKDFRIPIAEGIATFNILQMRGVESQFLTFPDENHWVLKPENSLVWHRVVLNWINKHVGLPLYSEEDPETDEFFGGPRAEGEEVTTMATLGVSVD